MHMADALLSTPVALTGAAVAVALIVTAGAKIKKTSDSRITPLMGVMGAFIFAAQMLNFSIPGTGSSGHIIGGVLLAALLGPWAGFLTLVSVLIIQCLIFADGGLMALGCNIVNMAAMTALVAYPLVYKPIAGDGRSPRRLSIAAIAACVVGLEAGALLVTLETELSGITALPTLPFLGVMVSIHLAIGICEGIATAGVLVFIARNRPDVMTRRPDRMNKVSMKRLIVFFAASALVIVGGLFLLASGNPDGLEWSIQQITGSPELVADGTSRIAQSAASLQATTSILPDYDNYLSGIVGACLVLAVVWAFSTLLTHRRVTRVGQNA